ncbi:MAG: flagellar biosynthetic protein FliR [Deltaproteobacteria bacterium]|nr:flagellar biosynthetic protein FliR [Deltaproteobacteria bacterium]
MTMNFTVDIQELAIWLAILLRLSLITFLLPIFNSRQLPSSLKACLALALSLVLHPLLRETVAPIPFELPTLLAVVVGELIFGIVVALSITLIFTAFQVAGELINFEMGFGFAYVVDPQSGTQTMLFSMWFQLIALMLFLGMNGHHFLLSAIVESFKVLPIGAFAVDAELYDGIVALSASLFIIAVKLSAPVVVALVMTQLGMGLMAKFAPQINILMTSFPLTIIIGLLFMSLSVLIWGPAMEDINGDLFRFLQKIMRLRGV